MKKIWLVQLQYLGSSWNPSPPKCRVVCACDTEELAHKVGQDIVWFYNHPWFGYQEHQTGVISEICINPEYGYAVKEHEGEWINESAD